MKAAAGIHRTTVEIETDAYEAAREALGTRGYRDTINQALREVSRSARLRHAADLVRKGGLPLVAPDELDELRRGRQ